MCWNIGRVLVGSVVFEMKERPVRRMSDDELTAELDKLGKEFDEFRDGLEGMSGSPGEWMVERMDEIETEQRRRLISLDGDIGRRNPR
jgi:hypothetical protein